MPDDTTTPDIPPGPEGDIMPVTAPTYPLGMTSDKLLIANLMPIMPGDTVYFGFGRYASTTESDSAFTASTVELNVVGLSCAQKDFLESNSFTGREVTIVVGSSDNTRLVVLNGLYWTVDIIGETDGLFQVTVSAEFSGPTSDRIHLYRNNVRSEE